MSDMQPNPSFGPVNPEEHLDQFEAKLALQELYDWALEEDEADQERRMSILERTVRLESRPYIQLGVDGGINSPMPCDYHQIVLRPEAGSFVREKKIFEIVARFPYYSNEHQPVDLPAEVSRWNDVSLEISFADSACYRYWLNGKGLIPYKDADSMDITFPRTSNETDLFSVLPEGIDGDARPLTGGELKMILRACQLKRQPNNPEDD